MRAASVSVLMVVLLALAACGPRVEPETATSVVYLVRHAEKLAPMEGAAPPDPSLTQRGRARAEALARTLGTEPIDRILSTDTARTRETAAPLAERTGLEVEIYDHRALQELAAELAATPGRHVVVGHSNTTPELVELLGGEPGDPSDEETEYDRLYVVAIPALGAPITLQLRYGSPSGS